MFNRLDCDFRYRYCSCCFTLIELLITIAIITILAGMLLPALKNARSQANMILCSGNMRQCHLGFVNYTGDYNDNIPAAMTESRAWHYYLTNDPYANYVERGYIKAFTKNGFHASTLDTSLYEVYRKEAGVLACPSVKSYKRYVMDYGMNNWLKEWAGTHYSVNSDMNGYIRWGSVKKPGMAVLMSEPVNSFFISYSDAALDQSASYRHNNNANAVHLDGHVASFRINTFQLRLPAVERP